MKKRFEKFTKNDLAKLRKEIVLNSVYTSDYNNSFGISADSLCSFFDGYVSYLEELAEEDNFKYDDMFPLFKKYDTIDNLYSWYCCFEEFDWVKYEEEKEVFDDDFYRGLTNQH